ncbi:sugar ABC transporter ATP-binding protein [Geitlerinema calcuttense]|uniref:Sugar ABC transporter ATP-binding protein n=1 Tax=Geitlerinema calcuttense NRMC-F 0142 TaxID=2922238 RepID=A0ABT7LYL9_9CYAN|nr:MULTISPECIES: sugar ABC transporter ATP-binding protein [Cyanophyceae]MDL5055305.1 sugar ABC transporter ATP-binding protein [Oscillatoria laete-virens NRMC-F 0139]MDL5056210.1 sugar ABC transporter ATP-binding protein [Geitlerinema calcuttense NRMC-F 0142]
MINAAAPLLQMQNISKSFFGVRVLNGVSFTLHAGEVHALLGENGAGKSTLIKILNGDYQMDSGVILMEGKPVDFRAPRDAEAHGIRMIYQELHYAPDLSVTENLLLGSLPRRRGRFGKFIIDWAQARRIAAERLALLELDIHPDSKMRDLSIVERQIVEIVKALSAEARIIVMDEPTAALTPTEVEHLFRIIRDLRQKGVAIIYISHRLDEIFQIAQRVTVLRDGNLVGTEPIESLTMASVVEMMVGHEIKKRHAPHAEMDAGRNIVLEVSGLTRYGAFEDISLQVHAGEILGIFGLIGSGQFSLTQSIFGAEPYNEGSIRVDGQTVSIHSPRDAQRAGIGFVPIDRKVRGLVMGQSVRRNTTLSNWKALSILGFFRQRTERQHTQHWIDSLGIRMAGGMEVPIRYLSGGNQQKTVLARWLEARVRVLILNEPTWGVDVGARSDIYDQLDALAAQGLAVLMVSSDIQEVLMVSHRILTIYRGRISGEFTRENASQTALLAAAAGETV